MKITVNRKEFIKAIEETSPIAKENKIRPVLSGIKAVANANTLLLTGTDLETTINSAIGVKIEKEGKAVFSYNEMYEYIKELEEDEITIENKENMLEIATENSITNFSTFDVNEYPTIKNQEMKNIINFDSKMLFNILNKVKIACNPNPDNLALYGVRIILKKDKIMFASSDTFRMALFEYDIENEITGSITIAKPAIEFILKLIKNLDTQINFSFSDNKACVKIENKEIYFRLIDLPFPDVENILEKFAFDIDITLDKRLIYPVLKRLKSIVKNNDEHKNGATFIFSGKGLELKAISSKAKANEKIKEIKTKDLKIALNIDFMMQYLDNVEIVEWKLGSNKTAVYFEEGNYKYFFMPYALRE